MTKWLKPKNAPIDVEVLEEAALAMAQSTIQSAISEARISRAELARRINRPRSFVTNMLSGSHNLTVRTMSRTLAACGYEVRFQHVPIMWNWRTQPHVQWEEHLPAQAGSTMPAENSAGLVVPACSQRTGAW